MTTLVVGCGYVGTALAERLVARGEPVVAITRSARPLPEGVEPLLATLPDATLRLPEHVHRVVYAVAPDGRTDDAYRRAYPEGVRSVLEALHRSRSRRSLESLVLVTSTAVYAEDAGGVAHEGPMATTPTAERILEAERAVSSGLDHWLDLPRRGEPQVVLRLSGIYGPGRTRLVRELREGRVPGEPNRIGNRIHRDDAAAAIEHVLFTHPPATIYDVTDEASVPMGEVLAWIARRIAAPVDPSALEVAPPLVGKRVDGSRLRATGFRLRYPTYREGYGPLLASG